MRDLRGGGRIATFQCIDQLIEREVEGVACLSQSPGVAQVLTDRQPASAGGAV